MTALRVAALLLTACGVALGQGESSPAYRALQRGRVDEAAVSLRAEIASTPNDARLHQLMCRVDYAQEAAEAAVTECRKAVELAPNDGENELWLGRALGMQASRANKLAAFGLARQVRTAFERAVALSPNAVAGYSDLGQFYVAAPGIVGGGTEKARRLAGTMAGRFAWQSHWLLGQTAAKDGDLPGAERELKASIAAGRNAEAEINLGLFYVRHGRAEEAVAAVQRALAQDRSHGPVLVDAASLLTEAKQLPEVAERALREYLAGEGQTEGAPAFKVHVQLGNLLARKGDADGARKEYADAVRLASHYEPARKALEQAGR